MTAGSQARGEQIAVDLDTVLGAIGLLVEEVTVTTAGKRRVVRVLVDRAVDSPAGDTVVEPLSLDEIGEATRVVSDRLDETDVMGEQPYVLEVSSPGIDRPLSAPRHFRRNVGRLVDVASPEGTATTGRIAATDADGVILAVVGSPEPVRIPFEQIAKARVQVEFNRPGGEESR